ncbi:MAG: ATP-binding protein [Bacilli bacterium]|nr:ATP-binding protein [Bacilli bacterium]
MERYKEIEKSIITKYRKDIYSRVVKGIQKYELIQENDKIMVCISGGKDSFLMAKCMEELQKHGKIQFSTEYVVMNPGYNDFNLKLIQENAKILNVPIHIFESNIFDVANTVTGNPCYLCARMRRGHLYNKAKELGCNKIALGHHFNDFIETTLLSMFYGAEVKTMMPKLHSDNFKGIDLIRPLCFVKEESIKSWVKYNNLTFINCACRFTEKCSIDDTKGKRQEIKKLINHLKETNPKIEENIYKALENVNLNCIIGSHDENKNYSFLDNFDK